MDEIISLHSSPGWRIPAARWFQEKWEIPLEEYLTSIDECIEGRAAKDEPLRRVLRSELSRERATRLEGSFGTQKQHYSLSRIKARNRKTEILWIFFGIHTANAVLMIDKIRNRTVKVA